MPSFDIVSKTDMSEVDNALQNISKEIRTRFDFKDSKSSIKREEEKLTVLADDDLKLKQMHELLKTHLVRRSVDPAALEYRTPEKASGNTLRQVIEVRQGIPAEVGKKIARGIKDSGLKVQAAIQGEDVRVTGKKRDDLQGAIALVKGMKLDLPVQFVNFRE